MTLVYVIEDDVDFGSLVQMSLQAEGYRVQLFVSASDAVEAFRRKPAQIVVSDIIIRENGRVVPNGGLSAIWRMKNIAKANGEHVFVVAISGAFTNPGMHDILTTADLLGADVALEKPFDPDDLLYTVGRGLSHEATAHAS